MGLRNQPPYLHGNQTLPDLSVLVFRSSSVRTLCITLDVICILIFVTYFIHLLHAMLIFALDFISISVSTRIYNSFEIILTLAYCTFSSMLYSGVVCL